MSKSAYETFNILELFAAVMKPVQYRSCLYGFGFCRDLRHQPYYHYVYPEGAICGLVRDLQDQQMAHITVDAIDLVFMVSLKIN